MKLPIYIGIAWLVCTLSKLFLLCIPQINIFRWMSSNSWYLGTCPSNHYWHLKYISLIVLWLNKTFSPPFFSLIFPKKMVLPLLFLHSFLSLKIITKLNLFLLSSFVSLYSDKIKKSTIQHQLCTRHISSPWFSRHPN